MCVPVAVRHRVVLFAAAQRRQLTFRSILVAASSERIEQDHSEGSAVTSYTSFMAVAWRHKALIGLGVAVGVVIGMLYYSRQPAIYQSNASLIVIKKGNPMPGQADDRGSFIYDYLADQQIIMKSPMLMSRAALHSKIKDLKVLGKSRNPAPAMLSGFSVQREPGRDATSTSNVLNLAFVSTDPEACQVVLDVIIDTYRDYLNETYKNATTDNLNTLIKLSVNYKKELDDKYEEIKKFRLEEGGNLALPASEGRTPEESMVSHLKTQRFTAELKRSMLQAQIKRLETALEAGPEKGREEWLNQIFNEKTLAGAPGADGQVHFQSLNDRILQLRIEKQKLRLKIGPQHPDVLALDEQIKMIRELGGAERRSSEDDQPNTTDPVQDFIRSMKKEVWRLDVELEAINERLAAELKDSSQVAKFMTKERDLQKQLDHTAAMIAPIDQASKQAQMTLNQDIGGFDAHKLAEPGLGYQIAPSQSRILMTAAFLGLCGGFGLAYLVEVMDKSFRTPDEIRRRLGCTVIGHIPVIITDQAPVEATPDGRPALDPRLCTYYQTKSFHSEAFRGLRTALYFSTQGEVHKVIQITSPQASDGKSTLVANLAICIAQSGRKVVLIDADLRKPRLHKMFGLSSTVGLASIISQEVKIKDAVQPTQIPGLSIIPCGPRPSNPAELLTAPVFKEFLDTIREEFDYVLIDTPPLLAVSDPSVVAPRVDGVILAIRVSKNGRPNAERAKEILNTLGANVLGVVVNGAGPRGGQAGYGYGYDSYRYNYGYAYNYSYDYSYSYDTYSSYYDDDEETDNGVATQPNDAIAQTEEMSQPEPEPEVHHSRRSKHRNGSKDSGFLSRFWKRRG